jgi:hypothetical protein
MKGTTSSGLSQQLKEICSICRCSWNVTTYKWKVHNGKIRMIFSAVLVNLLGYLPTVVVPALESNSTTENAKINRPLKIF